MDEYQLRYERHQERKRQSLMGSFGEPFWEKFTNQDQEVFNKIIKSRRSQRLFNRDVIDIQPILNAIDTCPSSCDRKGIKVVVIDKRDDKDLLSGLLVGGVGWIQRGDKILLLFADPLAYKAGDEIKFMPYLDAGVVITMTYLAAEVNNIGCCYVNPNIRESNKEFFNQRFNTKNHIYCGALALGKYDLKAKK